MPSVVNILPYSTKKSASARALATELGVKLVIPDETRSKYKAHANKRIINWGNSQGPKHVVGSDIINRFECVALATNKLRFFETIRPENRDETFPRAPDWTTNKNTVIEWLEAGFTAFARTKLNAHSGEGIVDVTSIEDLEKVANGTLFVKYIPKKQEWRIHLFRNSEGEYVEFLSQRKARKTPENQNYEELPLEELEGEVAPEPQAAEERGGAPDFQIPPNWRIRNVKNGFIYTRNEGNDPHPDIIQQAKKAISKLELDFGAVDVIFQEKDSRAFVLEINTAPGLVNSTVRDYAGMLQQNFLTNRKSEVVPF